MLRITRVLTPSVLLGAVLPAGATAQACRAVPSADYDLAAGLAHARSGDASITGFLTGLHAGPVSAELAYYTDGLGPAADGFGEDVTGQAFLWAMAPESEFGLEVAVELPPLPVLCLTVGGTYVPTEVVRFDFDAFGRIIDSSTIGHGRLFRLPVGLAGGHTFRSGPVAIAPAGQIEYELQRFEMDPFDRSEDDHDWTGSAAVGARYERLLLTLRARTSLRFSDVDAVYGATFRVFVDVF